MRLEKVAWSLLLGCSLGVTACEPAHAQDPGQTARTGRGSQQQGGAQQTLPTGPPGAQGGPGNSNFPQQTRQLAAPEVLARGKALYGVNCTACHGVDLRGGDQGGPNLLRSEVVLNDQHGELVLPIIHGDRSDKGMPNFPLSNEDGTAIAEYLHSIAAQAGRQGRPPGADKIPELKVIVGDPVLGKTFFESKCASCHSVTGDLAGFALKYPDARTLQNTWVGGGAAAGRGGFGPAADVGGKPTTVTVTMANGQKLEGTLIQRNDFVVALREADGTRVSVSRDASVKSVEVHEPNEAHKKMVLGLNNKSMHDITAYLATIK